MIHDLSFHPSRPQNASNQPTSMMTTTSTNDSKHLRMVQDRAVSLLQNEDRCVTVSGLAWTHHLHRPKAAEILAHAVQSLDRSSTSEESGSSSSSSGPIQQQQSVTQLKVTHCVVHSEDDPEKGNPPCTGKFCLFLFYCCFTAEL